MVSPESSGCVVAYDEASDDDGYAFAHERHADLVRALGMPEFAVLQAYASFERGEIPDGFSAQDFVSSA